MTWANGYDREWTADVDRGRTQIRYGLTKDSGVPVKFLVQLEYKKPGPEESDLWAASTWYAVALFDHDREGPAYRNVEDVGLHLDVMKPDGTQLSKRRDFPPVPIKQAMRFADDYLRHHHDFLVARFARWL